MPVLRLQLKKNDENLALLASRSQMYWKCSEKRVQLRSTDVVSNTIGLERRTQVASCGAYPWKPYSRQMPDMAKDDLLYASEHKASIGFVLTAPQNGPLPKLGGLEIPRVLFLYSTGRRQPERVFPSNWSSGCMQCGRNHTNGLEVI